MTGTPLETIETMLSSAVEETTDPEVQFKLRTALQLLVVVEEQQERAQQALSEVDLPEAVHESLTDLGYLD